MGEFCIACGLVALWAAWTLRGLWGCVFGGVLAVAYLTLGVLLLLGVK